MTNDLLCWIEQDQVMEKNSSEIPKITGDEKIRVAATSAAESARVPVPAASEQRKENNDILSHSERRMLTKQNELFIKNEVFENDSLATTTTTTSGITTLGTPATETDHVEDPKMKEHQTTRAVTSTDPVDDPYRLEHDTSGTVTSTDSMEDSKTLTRRAKFRRKRQKKKEKKKVAEAAVISAVEKQDQLLKLYNDLLQQLHNALTRVDLQLKLLWISVTMGNAMQSQKVVHAYFTSKQIPHFGFAPQHRSIWFVVFTIE